MSSSISSRLALNPREVLRRYVKRQFLQEYYADPSTWQSTYWSGVATEKCPLDLWIFQEIIFSTRPDLIIETGTRVGGSALFMASIFDLLGHGQVMTIDVTDQPGRPDHPRITYVHGSSTATQNVDRATERAKAAGRTMLVLDSDHSEAHVLEELRQLGPLVTPGCYLIVEDTIVNGRPVLPDFGPGPGEAVSLFLAEHPGSFEVDRDKEKFLMSFNPGGYLRRCG